MFLVRRAASGGTLGCLKSKLRGISLSGIKPHHTAKPVYQERSY